jgi:hypothetical protein
VNGDSGPLPSHLQHADSMGQHYRGPGADMPHRAADFRRNSSGRAGAQSYAASSSGSSSYSASSGSQHDGMSTADRAAGGHMIFVLSLGADGGPG